MKKKNLYIPNDGYFPPSQIIGITFEEETRRWGLLCFGAHNIGIHPFTMWSTFLLSEHQKIIKHVITLKTRFSACLLKYWNRKCVRTIWMALLCNLWEILSLLNEWSASSPGFLAIFLNQEHLCPWCWMKEKNQRILVTIKDFIRFVSEQMYPSIPIYIHITFLSAETYEFPTERVFLHPGIKSCSFVF